MWLCMHFPETRGQGQHVLSGHGVLAACTVENLGIAISPSTGHDFQVLLEVGPRHLPLRGYDNKSTTRINHPMDIHSAGLFPKRARSSDGFGRTDGAPHRPAGCR